MAVRTLVVLVAVALFVSTAGCNDTGGEERASNKLSVFVSILPLKFFVEQVGEPYVEVDVIVGRGQSPASYEPSPKQFSALARARLLFCVGVPAENFMVPRIRRGLGAVEVVDTRGVGGSTRDAHADGVVSNAALEQHADPHVWLDPCRAQQMAQIIRDALCRVDPAHTADYERNTQQLIASLAELDQNIEEILAPVKGYEFYVFHPSYDALADAYGLVQMSIERGGAEPGSKYLVEVVERMKRQHARVIFVQPQFSETAARRLANAIGAQVESLDPLAENYFDNLREIALAIRAASVKSS